MFRGGPFDSMFGNNPFFTDPFSQMDRMMNSMLSDPFFGNQLLRPPMAQQLPQQPRGRQPVIEEVDDAEQPAVTARDQPIVEEPDEDFSSHDRAAQRQRRLSPTRATTVPTYSDPFGSLIGALASGAASGAGGSSFVFTSSSYSATGPGGVSYQSSSSTRVGPGGVRETQAVVRDGRSGTESVTISRGLGDGRQRTLVRTRDATGREEQLENLQGITEHEADVFDEQWRQHAERNLPGGGAFGAVGGRLGSGSGHRGSSAQRPLALPSSTASGAGAPPVALRAPYPTHGTAGLSRQHSGPSSHYAPSTSGRSTASGAAAGSGPGAGMSYGGAGIHAGSYGTYTPGPTTSPYGSGGRAASAGMGLGANQGPSSSRQPASSIAGGTGSRSTYGSNTYAMGSHGQQRYRH